MGWLEVLTQLKRVLPLLTRVAPMLEVFIASRNGSRAESNAELQRVAGDIRAQLSATADQQGSVTELLAIQAGQIDSLAKNVDAMRAENLRAAASLLETEASVAALARSLRIVIILLAVLLFVCLVPAVLLLRHAR